MGPGDGVVDGFAILLEPGAEGFQSFHLDRRDGAVSFRAYVEEQVAVLADDVDEEGDEFAGRDGFCFAFGAVITEGAAQSTALFPFLRADLVELLVFRRREIGVLDPEAIVYDAVGIAL